MRSCDSRRGYTLIELVVTILIIGVLTSISVPQYMKTVETGKADDAVSTMNMVGTTNRMFALDHGGCYATGAFPAGAGATCTASGVACPAGPWSPCPVTAACALVACKYLADQDWGDKPYTYTALNGSIGANNVASATRNGGSAPYSTWGYTMAVSGQITATNGAPPATY
jgi:type IV pilus assembly protein PilE